jgi:hypothetical protein
MLYIMLDSHWQSFGFGFLQEVQLNGHLINGSLHESRGVGDVEMWFLSVPPHNSNTNYYKIITKVVVAKRFPNGFSFTKKILHVRSRSPAKQVLSITLRLA